MATATVDIKNVRMSRGSKGAVYFDITTGQKLKGFVHPEMTYIPEAYLPKKSDLFYITERHNPQLGVYYIAKGQMSKADAKATDRSIYGSNYTTGYATEAEYREAITGIERAYRAAGKNKNVQGRPADLEILPNVTETK